MRTGFYQEIFGRPLVNTVADIRKRLAIAVQAEEEAAQLRALLDLAFTELHMGSVPQATTAASDAATLADRLGKRRERAEATLWFSMCQHFSNDVSIATSFDNVAAALAASDLTDYIPIATILEAREALRRGDNCRAIELMRKAVAEMRTVNDPYAHAFVARTAAHH